MPLYIIIIIIAYNGNIINNIYYYYIQWIIIIIIYYLLLCVIHQLQNRKGNSCLKHTTKSQYALKNCSEIMETKHYSTTLKLMLRYFFFYLTLLLISVFAWYLIYGSVKWCRYILLYCMCVFGDLLYSYTHSVMALELVYCQTSKQQQLTVCSCQLRQPIPHQTTLFFKKTWHNQSPTYSTTLLKVLS